LRANFVHSKTREQQMSSHLLFYCRPLFLKQLVNLSKGETKEKKRACVCS
jgi:hypothetical protein